MPSPPRPRHPILAGDPHPVPASVGSPACGPARPSALRAAHGLMHPVRPPTPPGGQESAAQPASTPRGRGAPPLRAGAGREDFSLPTNSGDGGRGRGGTARGPGKGAFAPRPGHPSPRPASPAPGACGCAGRARTQPPLSAPSGSRRPRTYPAPRSCLAARRARSRAHSRFLLPRWAAGRRVSSLTRHGGRRLLPRSARGGRGAPSGRPAARREGARCARRAPGRAAGWVAPAQAAAPPPRNPALRLFPRDLRARQVQGTPVGPAWRLGLSGVSRCSANRDPGARGPQGPRGRGRGRGGPARMTPVCAGSRTAGTPGVGLWLGARWELREVT